MPRLLLVTVALFLLPALASGEKTAADRAVEKLKEIERDIRSRAREADDEIARARAESRRITQEAEVESARIKAEADAYTAKIQQEIREIREKAGIAAPAKPGQPSRQEISEALAASVDPSLACWDKKKRAEIESCVAAAVKQKLRPLLDRG